jgi:hypothetical protein
VHTKTMLPESNMLQAIFDYSFSDCERSYEASL